MEPCTDCGNEAHPLSKALFFDLDHSLVRPKVRTVRTASVPENLSAEGLEIVKNNMLAKAGKHIEFVDFITPLDRDKEGYIIPILSFRPTFPIDNEDWEFLPGVREALIPFFDNDYLFVIITNQGGIEAKLTTEAEVEEKISSILMVLAGTVANNRFDKLAYFYCPSIDPKHPDRKPNAGMILRAANKLNIDLGASYFVGDMESDKQAAEKAGIGMYYNINTFLVMSPGSPLLFNQK